MDFHVFAKVLPNCVIMAVPGVVVAIAMTAAWAYLTIFSRYPELGVQGGSGGDNWANAFLLGSILSATDPVAVVAVLQSLGAPAKLSSLIEGVSVERRHRVCVFSSLQKDRGGGVDDRPERVPTVPSTSWRRRRTRVRKRKKRLGTVTYLSTIEVPQARWACVGVR